MRSTSLLPPLTIVLALLLLACGSDNEGDTSPSATPTATTSAAEPSPSSPPEASPSPDATPTTMPAAAITPENFDDLEVVFERGMTAPQFMAWQEDGTLLVASHEEAVLIDAAAEHAETVYSGAGQEPVVAVSSRGRIATAAANSMGIDLRDLTGSIVASVSLDSQFGSADFSGDGSLLAVSSLAEISIDVFDAETGALRDTVAGFETAAPVYSGSLSPQGRLLVWRSRATLQTTGLASGAMSAPMEHEDFVSSVAVRAGGELLAAASGSTVTLWNALSGERIEDLDVVEPVFQLAFFPESGLLAVASDAGLRLWDTATFEEVATLDAGARMVAVAPDASRLATVDEGGVVRVWAPEE